MRFTLKQLRVFEAVSRLGGVSAAANEIALSQSAASAALSELEAALGLKLFNRHGKRLQLNENGRRLMVRARSLLNQAAEIERASMSENAALGGVLRLASTPELSRNYLAAIAAEFLIAHPLVRITVSVVSPTQVLDQVADIAVEVGFVDIPCNRTGYIVEQLGEDVMQIVASPTHPLAQREEISLAELQEQTWVLRERNGGARSLLTIALGQVRPDHLRISLEANDDELIRRAVIAGAGLGYLTAKTVKNELATGALVALRTDLSMRAPLMMVMSEGVYRDSLVPAFVDFARASFKMMS